jgi:hypothetical protein
MKMNKANGLHAIPFEQVVIPAGLTFDMIARPQVPVHGPYYLGIRTDANQVIYVERLQFANITPISGRGGKEAIPHYFFIKEIGKKWPDGLVPIDGPTLSHANTVYLAVRNHLPYSVTVNACVWATQDMKHSDVDASSHPPPFPLNWDKAEDVG